ncbi:TonB-dependent receptor [Chryseobacterium caseinilyticum]|uniref:TonB-dependent receptor n=1 Tax=Chryseobacterium caseinilyticum TaxID=2771428 RepID=A0ABR8ZCC8_9FLAO|nr:hypothetical protein [Chryseobacterium caseinilyticum]MBD8082739.1 hypothetical protein [Chryseobacterium caseinilyticum]
MKKIYLFLPLFAAQLMFAQNSQQYYSGIFLDKDKKPKAFIKVFNKNTGIYEETDEEGFAIIQAQKYDTLVWNNGKNIQVVYGVQELKYILENRIPKKSVSAIRSKDYDSLIVKPRSDEYSISKPDYYLSKNSDSYFVKIRKLKQKNGDTLKIKKQEQNKLIINGSFNTSFEVRNRNAIPQTQNRYVQGRSQSGNLIWRGPETNEIFSYGPDISTLAYNFQPYDYDINGQLVPLLSGMPSAKPYNNSLFSTTVGFHNQLQINAFIKSEDYNEKVRFSMDFGQHKNQTYFISQYDINNTFKAKVNANVLKFKVQALFDFDETKATNTNRIALFNRAYQESLLTPISFSNNQGSFLANGQQRTYSQLGDNPEFLFVQNNKYNFLSNQRKYSFNLSRRWDDFTFEINQSYENIFFRNIDIYKSSTNGFPNGLINERQQNNGLYNASILVGYTLDPNDFTHVFRFNSIFNDRQTDISHHLQNLKYNYQRTSQDYIFNYDLQYNDSGFVAGLNLGNSFYISNTSKNNKYWLPKASAFIDFKDVFAWSGTNLKILGAYTQMSSEPDITRSFSSYATTLVTAQNSFQYLPLQEAESFKNLSTIDFAESKVGFSFNYRQKVSFGVDYFQKKIINDIFPVFDNSKISLKNLADHTYKGLELNASYRNLRIGQNFMFSNKASFYKYRDVVDKVVSGYNNLALSGFQDVYKTLSEDQVLGAVVGNYYETNNAGQTIIDDFGFPVASNSKKIIADPTPDFVMKFTHTFNYKMFTLDVNWEWKKGGQLWNGTQAVLDYYGRSKTSGDDRNLKNYVFSGVHANGNVNQIPVDFYDPNLSVFENRWTRYGFTGVAESYVQNADYVRINSVSLGAKFDVGNFRRSLGVSLFVNNIMLWQANSGADPSQNFYDLDSGRGLDFFNLPSYKSFGCMVSFQF